jgi:hypothetical protein
MHKDEYKIGYTNRYIVLPKTYAVWDTQTNCWVADTTNEDKQIAHNFADKFNKWDNKTNS